MDNWTTHTNNEKRPLYKGNVTDPNPKSDLSSNRHTEGGEWDHQLPVALNLTSIPGTDQLEAEQLWENKHLENENSHCDWLRNEEISSSVHHVWVGGACKELAVVLRVRGLKSVWSVCCNDDSSLCYTELIHHVIYLPDLQLYRILTLGETSIQLHPKSMNN